LKTSDKLYIPLEQLTSIAITINLWFSYEICCKKISWKFHAKFIKDLLII